MIGLCRKGAWMIMLKEEWQRSILNGAPYVRYFIRLIIILWVLGVKENITFFVKNYGWESVQKNKKKKSQWMDDRNSY